MGKRCKGEKTESIKSDVVSTDLKVRLFRSQRSDRVATVRQQLSHPFLGVGKSYCQSAPGRPRHSSDSTNRSGLHKPSHAGYGFCWPADW